MCGGGGGGGGWIDDRLLFNGCRTSEQAELPNKEERSTVTKHLTA